MRVLAIDHVSLSFFHTLGRLPQAVGLILLTFSVTACVSPTKSVSTHQPEEPPAPVVEQVVPTKPEESAPSDKPSGTTRVPPAPVPAPPIAEAPTPVEEDTPVLESRPVVVVAERESYKVERATTATKTDTPIMQTPFSVQAVPQQVLKDQQIVRIDQALENVSGVTPFVAGAIKSFNVRGFNSSTIGRNGIQDRLTLVDRSFDETANLERIEVLKGPAAVLFGRIEPGGFINLVTKQPLSTPTYALQQQFGSFNFYRTTVDATGPLTKDDTLAYRVNLAYENSGSFREFVDTERVFFNPVLRWKLSERTQASVWLQYTHTDDTFDVGIPQLGNRPAPIPRARNLGEPGQRLTFNNTRFGFDWRHAFSDRWTLRHVFQSMFQRDRYRPLALLAAPPDPVQCSVQSCRIDRLFQEVPRQDADSYYTALNLTGTFDTWGVGHTLLFGGDYWRQTSVQQSRFLFAGTAIDLFQPVHTGISANALAAPDLLEKVDKQESWYGLYVQDQVQLPFNVHLLAGFRYDNAVNSAAFSSVEAGTPSFSENRQDDSAVTPRIGLVWQPLPALSLYGNYVEGFGGPNSGRSATNATLSPETAQQWEVGTKTELFEGRLRATLAWFDLTKQNIATPDPDPARALAGVQTTTGEARNRGLEFDLSGELWPGISAIASYAYIDSVITKDQRAIFSDDGSQVLSFDNGNQGHRLFGVPRHSGSVWLTYAPQQPGWQGLKLGSGVVARSEQQVDNENTFQVPGYALINLMASYDWRVGPSKVTLQFNVHNLFDKEYFHTGGSSIVAAFPGAPRTFLGSVRVEYW